MQTNYDDLSLYGITEELRALDDMLDSTGGEITVEWEQRQDMLVELLTKKVDGCVGYIQKNEDMIVLAKKQIERLESFIDSKKNRIANFKHYVKLCMQKTGMTEFEGVLCRLYEKQGSLSVLVENIDLLPFDLVKNTATAKKSEIAAHLKAGKEVPGARLVRGEPSIQFGLKKESRKRKERSNANESIESTEPATDTEAEQSTASSQ